MRSQTLKHDTKKILASLYLLSVPLLCFCSVCVPSAAQNCTVLRNPKTRHEEEASAYSILRPQAHVQVRECRAARFSESRSESGCSESRFTNLVFRKIPNPVPNPVFSNPGSPGPGPVGRTCTPELRHSRTHAPTD